MRERILIAAAIVTSGWLGACSKPTTDGQEIGAKAENGARQIQLAEPARPEGAVVSDLEAGRATERVLVQSRRGTPKGQVARGEAPAPELEIVPETHVHALSMTTSPALEPVLRLATAPAAPVFGVARAGDGSGQAAPDNYVLPAAVNRGPGIIIRGGRGRPDDDCDEHNLRGRTGGAAVNRLAPPTMGGNVRTSFRGGIR